MKIGLVHAGRVLSSVVVDAHSDQGLRAQLPGIREAWLRLLRESQLKLTQCIGVTMAFPSLMDPKTGRILDTYGKYADAPTLDLRSWARTEFNLPFAIENDARMALVGEWKFGAGRGCEDVVMMTLGTGLGTAAIVEGRLLRGCHGQAGVLGGHATIQVGGRRCSCGNVGCAEAEASTGHLNELAVSSPDWSTSLLRSAPIVDYRTVFETAAAGDPCAIGLRDRSLGVWSAMAVSLIHAYDPELLILGGGIMASGDVILPALRQYVETHAHTPWGKVRLAASELGDSAPLLAGEWLLAERRST